MSYYRNLLVKLSSVNLVNMQFPINITITPGIMKIYPKQENDPGIVWTPTTWNSTVDIIGSRVIARAGTTGSGNILETITKDTKTPNPSIIDIYRKFVKWAYVNKPNTPNWELKSKVIPLKK